MVGWSVGPQREVFAQNGTNSRIGSKRLEVPAMGVKKLRHAARDPWRSILASERRPLNSDTLCD